MKTKTTGTVKTKVLVFAFSLIIIAGFIVVGLQVFKSVSAETFAAATKRCGQSPVIGSDNGDGKIYYAPGNTNNNLLSEYNPNNVTISDYGKVKYFCSINEATHAGYQAHACCGLPAPQSPSN